MGIPRLRQDLQVVPNVFHPPVPSCPPSTSKDCKRPLWGCASALDASPKALPSLSYRAASNIPGWQGGSKSYFKHHWREICSIRGSMQAVDHRQHDALISVCATVHGHVLKRPHLFHEGQRLSRHFDEKVILVLCPVRSPTTRFKSPTGSGSPLLNSSDWDILGQQPAAKHHLVETQWKNGI